MTPRQRARRIRDINARLARIEEERRDIATSLATLENAHSWEMGFKVPLRGKTLLAEMDRRDAVAARAGEAASS